MVDDDDSVRHLITRVIKSGGYNVVAVSDGEAALEALRKHDFSLVFLDLKLPGMSGAEVLLEMKERGVKAEVVIITGHADTALMEDAVKFGLFTVMPKPFKVGDIHAVLNRVLKH